MKQIITIFIVIYFALGLISGIAMKIDFTKAHKDGFFTENESIIVRDGGTRIIERFGYSIYNYNNIMSESFDGTQTIKVGISVECDLNCLLIIPLIFQNNDTEIITLKPNKAIDPSRYQVITNE
jgi:hypothetical protein